MGLFKCGSRCRARREKRERKRDYKARKVELKYETKNNRIDTRRIAYEKGINPASVFADAAKTVGEVASNLLPGSNFQGTGSYGNTGIGGLFNNSQQNQKKNLQNQGGPKGNQQLMILGGLGLLGFLAFKKFK